MRQNTYYMPIDILREAQTVAVAGVAFLAGMTTGFAIRTRPQLSTPPKAPKKAENPRLLPYGQDARQPAPGELWPAREADPGYNILSDDSVMQPLYNLLCNETKNGLELQRAGQRLTMRLCADYGIGQAAWKELTEALLEKNKAYQTKGKGGKLITVLRYSKAQAFIINMRNKKGWVAAPPPLSRR